MKGVAIVGGGVSGLAAAYYLSRHHIPCTLFEREARTGGLLQTERVHGCLVEAGPDSWLAEKRWMRSLVEELGLGGQVMGSNDRLRRTYIVRNGRLVPLPDSMHLLVPAKPWQVLTTRVFGPATKARMLAEWFHRPRERPDRSVAEFVRDHFGTEAVNRLAQPMMAGVYGAQPEDLSARQVLPRFAEYERRYGSILRGLVRHRGRRSPDPLFLTLRDGLGALVGALQRRIEGHCEIVHRAVLQIRRHGCRWRLGLDGETFEAAAVILAVPAHEAGRLLQSTAPGLTGDLGAIPYSSSAVVALAYPSEDFRHPLDGFGFLVPGIERARVAACTWVGTKFDGRAGPGRVLLRAFLTGSRAEDVMRAEDEGVVRAVDSELRGWMGFDTQLIGSRVYRWPRAMPAYGVGHDRLVRSIERRLLALPGLLLAGNGYSGLGIPDCIRRSREVAETFVKDCRRQRPDLMPDNAGRP